MHHDDTQNEYKTDAVDPDQSQKGAELIDLETQLGRLIRFDEKRAILKEAFKKAANQKNEYLKLNLLTLEKRFRVYRYGLLAGAAARGIRG